MLELRQIYAQTTLPRMVVNKNYEVNVDVWVDRTVWKFLGFGDQPKKSEVTGVYQGFTSLLDANTLNRRVTARYAGAPGHYVVRIYLAVEQSVWKRFGFGDSSSLAEVRQYFEAKTATFSDMFKVEVRTLAKGELPR